MNIMLKRRLAALEKQAVRSTSREAQHQASLIVDQLLPLEKEYPGIIDTFEKGYETKFRELCSHVPEKSFDDFTPERLRGLILQTCEVSV